MENVENAENYTSKKYVTPDGAPADIVIFTLSPVEDSADNRQKRVTNHQLQVLLIKRKNWPDAGKWALPGGFSTPEESLYEAALRELKEETSVANVHVEYFNQYSTPHRDPRGWIISHSFFAIVPEYALKGRMANDDAVEVELFPYEDAIKLDLAFDHLRILTDAYKALRQKTLQTDLPKHFLDEQFTMTELQSVLEAIVPGFNTNTSMHQKFLYAEKRSGIIQPVLDADGEQMTTTRNSQRPAKLFKFTGFFPELSIYG